MSLHRVLLAALLSTALFSALAPSAFAQDFTCHPAREHCLAEERDNFTIYVDTDGSMNARSDRNVCCGGGNDSYWEVVKKEIEDAADFNDNSGPCNTGASCQSSGCDGVRLGIGYFGDDSAMDSGDGIIAYQDEAAGENKATAVKNSIGNESAGNIGDPGIETLSCPPNGPGQTDTITCPVNGLPQASRIWCPPNGGIQVDEIGCPFDGRAQVDRIACPGNASNQVINLSVFLFTPNTFYSIDIDGESFSWISPPLAGSTALVTGVLYAQMIANPYMIANFTMSSLPGSSAITLTRNTAGVDTVLSYSPRISGWKTPADPTGLPTTPPVGNLYNFRINGNDVEYTSVAGDLSQDVCAGLATDINGLGQNVVASASFGILTITSTLPGQGFSVTNIDSNELNYMGTPTGNLSGVPGDPAAAKEFDFRINGTKVAWDHAGAGETALNVCNELIDAVNNSGEDVSASLFNWGLDAYGRTDYRIRIQSTVVGQGFNITSIDSDLRDFGTSGGGAGLPGDPGDGYVFDFMLNSSLIQATGNTGSDTASVCADLLTSVNASGEPVNVSTNGSYITITPQVIGEPFTITGEDTYLFHEPVLTGSAGLPGTPGASHTYSWDWTDYTGSTSPINVPSPAVNPSTATVCSAIAAQLDAMPEFNATLNASMNQVTITPQIQGLTWTFSNMDTYLAHTSSLNGDLPNNPSPNNQYDFRINGIDVNWTDDGTPTQNEVCVGVTNRINTVASGVVSATHDGSTITITGTSAAAFDITSVESDLAPHNVVAEAGMGPSAFGQLASRINADLSSTTRTQNAVAITHRGPEDFADFSLAVDELCAKRDHATSPATTHFIAVDVTTAERRLIDILAAAGGSGGCSGGIDPCTTANASLAGGTPMANLVSCWGTLTAHEWYIDNRLSQLYSNASCTFELDVPPTYTDGVAPTNTNATRVTFDDICHSHDSEVNYLGNSNPWTWWAYVNHCYGGTIADNVEYDGWRWPTGGDRSEITFEPGICQMIRDGQIDKIETHVGCLCAQQGEECTAAFVDAMGVPIPCKSPTHGRCDNPGGMDPTICTGGTATGECSDDSYCMQTCTPEQLAVMRCATGVFLCDESSGTDDCTAGADNQVPEICNGLDDDCDGLVDNMSNNADDAFAGYDTQGRDCNGADACMCPDEWRDVPAGTNDLQDHLDSWSGNCECGEALEAPQPTMSQEIVEQEPSEPADLDSPETNAACAVAAGEGRADFMLIGLLGLLLFGRRRRA